MEKSDKKQNITDYTEQERNGSSSTNNIYQKKQEIKYNYHKKKIWTIALRLESPKSKYFQSPDLKIDFLIDSGAESNIIKIPTWNELQILHPKLLPSKTSSKLATSQGSILTNFEEVQLLLVPTRTIEQNILLTKLFKQIFHITDIKPNITEYHLLLNLFPPLKS